MSSRSIQTLRLNAFVYSYFKPPFDMEGLVFRIRLIPWVGWVA